MRGCLRGLRTVLIDNDRYGQLIAVGVERGVGVGLIGWSRLRCLDVLRVTSQRVESC